MLILFFVLNIMSFCLCIFPAYIGRHQFVNEIQNNFSLIQNRLVKPLDQYKIQYGYFPLQLEDIGYSKNTFTVTQNNTKINIHYTSNGKQNYTITYITGWYYHIYDSQTKTWSTTD